MLEGLAELGRQRGRGTYTQFIIEKAPPIYESGDFF